MELQLKVWLVTVSRNSTDQCVREGGARELNVQNDVGLRTLCS